MTDQPMPTCSDRPAIQDRVIADFQQRKTIGLERYNTLLTTFNGRSAAQDAYEEQLDLVQYLRQLLDEWAVIQPVVDAAVAFHRATIPAVEAEAIGDLMAAVEALLAVKGASA